MKHYIITRYNLELYTSNPNGVKDVEQWMEGRVPLFERCKQSVLGKEDFEWWLLIDPLTPQKWRDYLQCDSRIKLKEVKMPNELVFPRGWKLTSRLDSDDYYLPGAIRTIQKHIIEREIVLDIDYTIFDGVHNPSNRPRANSMFASLVNNKPNVCVYHGEHSTLPDKYRSFKIKKVLAVHDIHGGNLFNKLGDNWI